MAVPETVRRTTGPAECVVAGNEAVSTLYNINYSVGQIGHNLLGGALSSNVSLLDALVVTSLVLLGCVPLIYFIRLRPVGVAPAAD
jgi:hypothetical protein